MEQVESFYYVTQVLPMTHNFLVKVQHKHTERSAVKAKLKQGQLLVCLPA